MSRHLPEFPITEELPAVRLGGGGARLAKFLTGLLVLGIVMIGGALLYRSLSTDSADEPTLVAPAPTAVPISEPVSTAGGSEDRLPNEPASLWQVVNVSDRLNVRAGPGTSHPVITTLGTGDRITGTGERASVNGSEWKQITVDGQTGWASGRFLAPSSGGQEDDEPGDSREQVEPTPRPGRTAQNCFQGQEGSVTRTLRLDYFGPEVVGVMRTDDGTTRIEWVEGRIANGQAQMVVTDQAGSGDRLQQWTFGAADISLGGSSTVRVVSCGSVADLLG